MAVGGLGSPMKDLEIHSFRNPDSISRTKLITDRDSFGGFSTAKLEAVPFPANELPPDYQAAHNQPPPHYGKFTGNINIDLPPNRPDIERSGFAAWRMADPGWSLLGKALYNCEPYAFLALRFKADNSRYFVNVQVDSFVATDLYQHRLFANTPGRWETVYIPFTEFVKTHMGRVLKSQGYFPKNLITTVGLGLIDRIPGPFGLCIDRIWATNHREKIIDEDDLD
ncbi:complex I intermediate-associated protein 30 [Sphaerosporella brunnea]|uniref:Complex I intermediate-associated protein 30 n=1 Tax=Sphaerosporella brunnea TaxID=1250544 RepID=A0A5J5FC15_9PEZI|nr:complex I intermediate-associated protein 30 [Sphaerosporella brunnea]